MNLTGNSPPPPHTKVQMILKHIFLKVQGVKLHLQDSIWKKFFQDCAMDSTLRLQVQLVFGEPSVGEKRCALQVMDSLPKCLVEATHVIHLKDWGVRL